MAFRCDKIRDYFKEGVDNKIIKKQLKAMMRRKKNNKYYAFIYKSKK